jgi:8-oxo-dGTP pyrophosphatase MutT (NUDIX family)
MMKYFQTYESFELGKRNEQESYEVHDNSSGEAFYGDHGTGVLPICTKTKRILLGFRSAEVNEPHTWGVFGGKFDEDDYTDFDPEVVALRELQEETGYLGPLQLVPAYIFKTANDKFTYFNYIGIVDEEFKPILDWENEQAKWYTLEEIEILDLHFGLEDLLKNSEPLIKQLLYL